MSLSDTQTYSRRRTTALAILLAFLASLLVVNNALADDPPKDVREHFELDGNVASDGGVDWTDFFDASGEDRLGNDGAIARNENPLPPGFVAAEAKEDYVLPDVTTFTQGSKDIDDIGDWTCTRANNVNNKVDILNAYAVGYRNGDNDLILYYGMEIKAPEGSSNIGVWFLKDGSVECERFGGGSQPFEGNHEDGDVLVVSAFTDGGTEANITVYKWEDGAPVLQGTIGDAHCDDFGDIGTEEVLACATVNDAELTTPWNSPVRGGGPLEANQFFEGGINITEVVHGGEIEDPEDECFSKFLFNTRSSPSITSALHDFASDDFNVCGGLTIVKKTEPVSEIDVDFDIEILGPGFESTQTVVLNTETTPTVTYANLLSGEYTITEVDIPDGWALVDVTCVNDDDPDGDPVGAASESGDGVTVDLAAEGDITCTFTNRQHGSVLIEKEYTVDPGADFIPAQFRLWEDDDVDLDLEDDPIKPESGGEAMVHTTGTVTDDGVRHFYCVDELAVDDQYWVFEESTPEGFVPADPIQTTASVGTCQDRLGSDPANTVTGDDLDGFISNEPGPVSLTVEKWKLTLIGGETTTTDTPLADFEFTLYAGETTETVIETTSTTSDGSVTFTNELEVGETYTVCETGLPDGEAGYWTDAVDENLDPAVCQTFTTELNQPVTLAFYNAPRAKFQIEFFDMTGFTSAELVCEDPDGNETRQSIDHGEDADGDSHKLIVDHADLGDYDCRIEIRNGADPEPEPDQPE